MRFSERMGIAPKPDQSKGLTEAFKTRLSNVVRQFMLSLHDFDMQVFYFALQEVWGHVFKQPVEQLAGYGYDSQLKALCKRLRDAPDHELWDAIDLLGGIKRLASLGDQFRQECNEVFAEEGSPYMFIKDELAPVMNATEAAEVGAALATTASANLEPVNVHLRTASKYLVGTSNDFRNSIKESISAVEATVRITVGKSATLGEGLKLLEKAGVVIHPALREAYSKIYGFTNDEGGVRHSLELDSVREADLEDLAVYMLVSCSAFTTLLIKQARKAGVKV